jgi:hypothetical protein
MIEVLVGMTLLAAMPPMVASLVKARENSRQTVCGIHLRGFANALFLYEAEHAGYPDMGNEDEKLDAKPTGLGRDAGVKKWWSAGDNIHCNIQPMWLLINDGGIGYGQFQCPSDNGYVPVAEKIEYGLDDWHNSSYGVAPISSHYKAKLSGRMADPAMTMMGDRPRPGFLDAGSANHRDGGNFLSHNGAVRWEESNDFGYARNNVYLLDLKGDNAAYDSFVHFQKDNTKEKPKPAADAPAGR